MVLEIMFTGLIAFVKGHCEMKDTDTMSVLMVQGDTEPHKSRLTVDIRSVFPWEPGDLRPDEIIGLPDGTQLAVWSLDARQITLQGAKPIRIVEGKRRKRKVKNEDMKNDKLKDQYLNTYPREHFFRWDPRNDLTWAPELDRACLLKDNTSDDLFAKPEVLDDKQLGDFGVARFAALTVSPKDAPDGNILEAVLDDAKKRDVYEFKGQVYDYRQVLADRARLKMTLDGKEVTISLKYAKCHDLKETDAEYKELGCAGPDPKIRLLPRENEKSVTVSVSNLPTKKGKISNELHHFHDYYKLLTYGDPVKCPTPKGKYPKDEQNLTEIEKDRLRAVQPIKCAMCSTCGPD